MVILFGPAGSGKSVQGKLLAEKNGWTWLSMGQILRDADDPELNDIMQTGKLVPFEVTNRLIDEKLNLLDQNKVVIDGYPRQMEQAEWLIQRHIDGAHTIDLAIVLDVPREESVKRLLKRARADDTVEAIEERLKIYLGQTVPIVYTMKEHDVPVARVDGVGSIEAVHERITQQLKERLLI